MVNLTWISRTGKMRSMRMRRRMRAEKLVVEGHRAAITELEFIRAEVREAGWRTVLAAEGTGVQIQREAAHLARAAEEGVPAHRRQLLQPALFASLVLEPDLEAVCEHTDPTLIVELFKGARSALAFTQFLYILGKCVKSQTHNTAIVLRYYIIVSRVPSH